MSFRCYQNKFASGWAQSARSLWNVPPSSTPLPPTWSPHTCDLQQASTPTSIGSQASEMNYKAGAQNSQNSGPETPLAQRSGRIRPVACDAPRTRFQLSGEDFARAIHAFRGATTGRPTVFVGHSLSGNVIQHGLLYANSEDEFKDLAASVLVVFLGSPLRGTKLQFLPHLLTAVISLAGSHDGIIKELAYDDPSLAEMVKRPKAQLLSLFQHSPTILRFSRGHSLGNSPNGEFMATAFVNSKGAPPLEEAAKSGYVEVARRMLD
ncbi:hypothetical protein EDB80DRAFT_828771 [Ilyonectria destructans]|nr:hypothetical protein EDB80DRAFT_828771 [Ilyonectria destructans]